MTATALFDTPVNLSYPGSGTKDLINWRPNLELSRSV